MARKLECRHCGTFNTAGDFCRCQPFKDTPTSKLPPKNRDFLGLVDNNGNSYWDIFFWATKEDGVGGRACYTDRGLFDMPKILRWQDLPSID